MANLAFQTLQTLKKFGAICAMLLLAACQETSITDFAPKAERELPAKIVQKMKAKGMNKSSPVMFRLFKDEHVVEVWKQKTNGRYEMITNYNICAWSGTLGPKLKEGDRQAPEGYYPIKASQLNPSSKYFLALNTGFPNIYDRALGRSGADLMIHGACSSSGCYSMTDDSVQEIFAFARDAFEGGQTDIMLEALPFRMTPEKMALYSTHKDFAFWQMLKEGYDYFELTKTPPKVDFCEKKYVFNRVSVDGKPLSVNAACPPLQHRSSGFVATYQSYEEKYQSSYASAAKRFANTPFPIVQGGKSRPLDKKWKPQPVRAPRGAGLPTPSSEPVADDVKIEPTIEANAASIAAQDPVATTKSAAPAAAISTAPQPALASDSSTIPTPTANPTVSVVDPAPTKKQKWWQVK